MTKSELRYSRKFNVYIAQYTSLNFKNNMHVSLNNRKPRLSCPTHSYKQNTGGGASGSFDKHRVIILCSDLK